MKNSMGRIFVDDVRYVKSNLISLMLVVLLCLAPALFAWFSIAGSWDPAANTGKLRVAIANGDDGYKSDLMPLSVNVGDRVVSSLHENNEYGWIFVSEEDAIQGVNSGEYYAAIVIPDDFSRKMMSVFSATATQADIDYYVNLKENPLATVLAAQDAAAAAEDIRVEFTAAVDDMTLDLANDIVSFATGEQVDGFGLQVVDQLGSLADDLNETAEQARAFANLASTSSALTDAAAAALSGSGSGADVATGVTSGLAGGLEGSIEAARSATRALQVQVESNNASAPALLGDLASLSSSIESISNETGALASAIKEASTGLSGNTQSLSGDMGHVRDNLNSVADKLDRSAQTIRQFRSDIASALSSGNLAKVAQLIGDDTSGLAEWLAAPVVMEKQELYPSAGYGSSVAPLFTVIALWAGVILLLVLLRPHVSDERLNRYNGEGAQAAGASASDVKASGASASGAQAVKGYQSFFGRFLGFAVLALVQATLVGLGEILFLHVQCANPLLFMAACWVCALAFAGIAYMLVVLFGGVGKALLLVLLLVQLVGLNGAYPIQMMGGAFQALHPFMPFTYGVQVIQSSLLGILGPDFAISMALLGAFFVASLVLGFALFGPCKKAAKAVGAKLGEAGLM